MRFTIDKATGMYFKILILGILELYKADKGFIQLKFKSTHS